jgi:hypothetical protein
MAHAMEYPLFVPPPPLFEKSHFDWTPTEARAYFEWFLAQVEPRSRALLALIGEEDDGDPAVFLPHVGSKLAVLVRREPFSAATEKGLELTNAGYALAADAGLLFARALVRHYPNVRWDIVRKPKRDMAFRLPVLVGPGTGVPRCGRRIDCRFPRYGPRGGRTEAPHGRFSLLERARAGSAGQLDVAPGSLKRPHSAAMRSRRRRSNKSRRDSSKPDAQGGPVLIAPFYARSATSVSERSSVFAEVSACRSGTSAVAAGDALHGVRWSTTYKPPSCAM